MAARNAKGAHDKAASSVCGSPRSKGKEGTCQRPAGWGTDHVGDGRCKLHGGKSKITHGRYSKITRPRLKELIAQFEGDPDPLNLLPEVILLRALIQDYVERYDQFTEALLAWHSDWKENRQSEKPQQVIDILSAAKFIGQIGTLIERIEKQKQEGTISLEALDRVVEQFGVELVAAAQEVIQDADTRSALLGAVERRWGTIRIDAKPGRKGSSQG